MSAPEWLPAGSLPGGLIVHVYDGDELLSVAKMHHDLDMEDVMRQHSAEIRNARHIVVVFYDGTTGQRIDGLEARR